MSLTAIDITAAQHAQAARALSHPLRARVLDALAGAPASPSEIAVSLNAPLSTVSYHFRILAALGFLELLGTVPRRGALEHRYRATARITVNIERLAKSS